MKKLTLSSFYLRSSIFVILSVFAAALNYILYPILTRILSPGEFGDFAAVVALSNQIAAILLAFNLISIYLVKFNNEAEAREKAQVVQKILIWLFIVLTGILFISAPVTRSILNLNNTESIIIISLIQLTAVPAVIWTGYLQGHKQLAQVGVYNVASSLGKLIFAVGLSVAFGAVGGVWGLLVGALTGLVTIQLVAGRRLPSLGVIFKKLKSEEANFLKSIRAYVLGSIFVVGVFGVLQNLDITIAKAMFSANEAGVYGGVSILSNSLYYLSFLLVWVILPEISADNPKNNRRVLGTAYKLMALLTVGVLSAEFLLRDQITGLLLGPDFKNQGAVLIIASIFQLLLVASALYAFYLLVMRKKRAVLFAGFIGILAASLPILFAQTPLHMIQLMVVGVILGVLAYITLLAFLKLRRNRESTDAL